MGEWYAPRRATSHPVRGRALLRETQKTTPLHMQGGGFGNGWRTDLVSHTATVQYLQRWNVSRPGSGWDGVGPLRFVHANGSGSGISRLSSTVSIHEPIFPQGSPQPCARVASICHHISSSRRFPGNLPGVLPDYISEYTHLGGYFPLRCFQRFLRPDVATEPAGRPTIPPPAVCPIRSSRTKISSPQYTKRS